MEVAVPWKDFTVTENDFSVNKPPWTVTWNDFSVATGASAATMADEGVAATVGDGRFPT